MSSHTHRGNFRVALPWLLATLVLVVVAALLMLVFSQAGSALFPAYRYVSRALMGALATAASVVPFSLWTWGLVVMAAAFLASLLICLVRHGNAFKWFFVWLFVVAALGFFAVAGWALNHYAPALSEDLGLEVTEYTEEQLFEATAYYYQQASRTASAVPRDSDGSLQRQDFAELAQLAGTSYVELGKTYEVFNGVTVPVKEMSFGGEQLLSLGSDGIFWPLTGEANVPSGVAVATEPFNMCHEAAHRLGIAGEDEANFAAFLACTTNSDVRFQYSGYYRAFVACYNALVTNYPEFVNELLSEASTYDYLDGATLLVTDIVGTNVTYAAYEGPANDAGQATNDTYLKLFSEESGVQSYGQVTDYLIAWYIAQR